jgi:hypothetical protein
MDTMVRARRDEVPPATPDERPPTGPARWRPARPSRSGWITAGIAALATVLYTWSLSSVGYANGY